MFDLEVKKIKIVPFTIIGSIILAITSFLLYSILIIPSIANTLLHPIDPTVKTTLLGAGICLLLASFLATLIVSIPLTFTSALLYNKLNQKLKGIQIKLDDNCLTYIKPLNLALNLSIIVTILTLTTGIVLTIIAVPIINLMSLTQQTNNIGALNILTILTLNIILPIISFITTFTTSILVAAIYNKINTHIQQIPKIQLDFIEYEREWLSLKYIKPLTLAINTSIIILITSSIFGLILLILSIPTGKIIESLITIATSIITLTVIIFIITYIITVCYNKITHKTEHIKIQ